MAAAAGLAVAAGAGDAPTACCPVRFEGPAAAGTALGVGAASFSDDAGPLRVADREGPEAREVEEPESEPLAPAEPVRSAKAFGAAAIADPTPRATARAPKRPTYLA
jgi:hypothetical protein